MKNTTVYSIWLLAAIFFYHTFILPIAISITSKEPASMPIDHVATMSTAPFDEIIMRDNGLLLDSAQISIVVKIRRAALSGGQPCVKYPDSLFSVVRHGRAIELKLSDKGEQLLLAGGILTHGNNKQNSVDTAKIEIFAGGDSLSCYAASAYTVKFDNINLKKLEVRYPHISNIEISGRSMIGRMRAYRTTSIDKKADKRSISKRNDGAYEYIYGEPAYQTDSKNVIINIGDSSFIKYLALEAAGRSNRINGTKGRIGTLTVSGKGNLTGFDYDVCDKLFVFPSDSSISVTISDIKQKVQLK